MSTWSDPARYAATLAEILKVLGRAILADEATLRQHLAHVETLRAGVCRGGRDRYSTEADERWEAIGDVLCEASDLASRIREKTGEAREARGRLARAREEVDEESDIDRAAEAKRVRAKHMAADRATLTEAAPQGAACRSGPRQGAHAGRGAGRSAPGQAQGDRGLMRRSSDVRAIETWCATATLPVGRTRAAALALEARAPATRRAYRVAPGRLPAFVSTSLASWSFS